MTKKDKDSEPEREHQRKDDHQDNFSRHKRGVEVKNGTWKTIALILGTNFLSIWGTNYWGTTKIEAKMNDRLDRLEQAIVSKSDFVFYKTEHEKLTNEQLHQRDIRIDYNTQEITDLKKKK